MENQLVTIPVPGTSTPIMAVQHDGTEWVAARHICDVLGINWKSQHRKLTDRSWSTVQILTTVGADGKVAKCSWLTVARSQCGLPRLMRPA